MTTIEKLYSPVVPRKNQWGFFDVVKNKDVSEEVVGRLVLISSAKLLSGYCTQPSNSCFRCPWCYEYQGNTCKSLDLLTANLHNSL